MARKFAITLGAFIILACVASAQDAQTVVANTLKAMGGENMKSLQFTASGSGPGQLKDGNTPGPRSLIKSYVYTVDYTIPAARLDTGVIGGLPPQTQLGGEGRAAQFVNGEYAWDVWRRRARRHRRRPAPERLADHSLSSFLHQSWRSHASAQWRRPAVAFRSRPQRADLAHAARLSDLAP